MVPFVTGSDLYVFVPYSMEDLTDPEAIRLNPKCDRTVSLYGYLRGTFMKNKSQVHIPGELSLKCAKFLADIVIIKKENCQQILLQETDFIFCTKQTSILFCTKLNSLCSQYFTALL